MKIGIVGAGVAGLVAAIKLAHKKHSVTVYESADGPGGKLIEKRIRLYRFDLGPSLFTMPHWIDDLYTELGKNPQDYYNYKKLEIGTYYFYEDGTAFNSHSDFNVFKNILNNQGIDANNLKSYFNKIQFIYNTTEQIFLKSSLHKWSSYCKLSVLRSFMRLPFIKSLVTMNAMNKEYFKDERLQQYFNRMATYNGSDPYQAPGTLNLISHIEHSIGTYYPQGGMYSIVKGLYSLALDLGVTFEFNTKVDEIIVVNHKTSGIRVKSHRVDYDIVVSNMDIYIILIKN